jgi:MoxR-like ATPase
MLARALSLSINAEFRRLQCTPDLLPSDITGVSIFNQETRQFQFVAGPAFTNILLADEINRATPRAQAALLECMGERQVTVDGLTRRLPRPFLVLATQNPVEYEGTFPLPEAQLDRFLLMVRMEYPQAGEEVEILRRTTGLPLPEVEPALGAAEILRLRTLVRQVPVSETVLRYAATLVRATRPGEGEGPADLHRWLRWGAGPRAGQAIILTSRARALLHGRLHVSPEDVRAVSPAVLRHRLLLNFHAEAEGHTPDELVTRLLHFVPAPTGGGG